MEADPGADTTSVGPDAGTTGAARRSPGFAGSSVNRAMVQLPRFHQLIGQPPGPSLTTFLQRLLARNRNGYAGCEGARRLAMHHICRRAPIYRGLRHSLSATDPPAGVSTARAGSAGAERRTVADVRPSWCCDRRGGGTAGRGATRHSHRTSAYNDKDLDSVGLGPGLHAWRSCRSGGVSRWSGRSAADRIRPAHTAPEAPYVSRAPPGQEPTDSIRRSFSPRIGRDCRGTVHAASEHSC